MTIIYFSPTGNVRYLSERLSHHMGSDSVRSLPLEFTNPQELEHDDHLIIMYSIHAFNPPSTVRRFIKKLPAGLFEDVSLISVGCAESWVNSAASSGIRAKLQKKGYPIIVDEIMAMPLTFIISFTKELIKKQITDAEIKIEAAAKSILEGKQTERNIPVKSKILHAVGKVEGPAAGMFGLELHAGKNCTSCGKCVKNCPEQNIRFKKNQIPKFGLSCLMCMRCIYNCPEKAVSPRLAKFIPIKNGFNISDHL